MSQLLKTLNEKRGAKLKEAQEITSKATEEKRGFTEEERNKIRGINDEIEGLNADITEETRSIANASHVAPQLSKQEERDINRFDLGVVLRSLASGEALEGIEAEVIAEGRREAREAGVNYRGMMLPRMVVRRESRDMTATGTTSTSLDQGGMTIATEKRGLADDFYNASLIRSLGATVLEGLSGNVDLPRLVAGTAPSGKAENASADEVSPTTAMLSLTPNRLPAFIDLSEQLLRQSGVAIEAVVRSSLTSQMLAVQEAAFFHGSGSNEANGIAGTSGIGSVAGGTNGAAPTWAHLVGLETEVDTDNALMGRLSYATNGQIRGKLKTTPKVASTDSIMLLDDRNPNTVNGYGIGFSNAISRTLTKGTASGVCSAIFFGNFADYVIGYWGGISLELLRDSTNAKTGLYTLVASTYYDGGVLRPKSFAAMLDALGA